MSSNTWKNVERRVAKFFSAERTPLSGGNSKHTRSDSLHDKLFIETKHRKKMAIWTLYDKTKELAKKEDKIPILALHEKHRKGFLICMHKDNYDNIKLKDGRFDLRAKCKCGWSGFPRQLEENEKYELLCPKCKQPTLTLIRKGVF